MNGREFWEEIRNALLRYSNDSLVRTCRSKADYYIPLSLMTQKKTTNRERRNKYKYEVFLQEVLEEKESQTNVKRIALIGNPGSGKTNTLRDIGFWILEKKLGVPIWISPGDLIKGEDVLDLETYLFEKWIEHIFYLPDIDH